MQTHVIKETGDSGKRDKEKCPVCDDHHDVKECQVLLSQTMEDKQDKKNLCYGYLGNENIIQKVVPIEGCSTQYCMV